MTTLFASVERKSWGFFSRIAAMLLAVLGFSSCDSDDDDPMICMYGMPYSTYEVKGTVTDENNDPVEGAEVTVKAYERHEFSYPVIYEPVKTDANGNYTAKFSHSYPENNLRVVVSDASHAKADSVDVAVSKDPNAPKPANDFWYEGSYNAQADIVLKSPVKK